MALPKVTPGTYDYGAYANPKAVQYKGGQQAIGAAVGKLFGDIGAGFSERMAQDKKDKKEVTDFIVNTVGAVNPEVKAGNITDIKAFAEDYGKLKLDRRRNKISEEEYIKAESALQSQYQFLQTLPEIFDSGFEGEIDLNRLKGKDAKRNLFLHKAMNSGNVRTVWDSGKKEFSLQWTSDDGETFNESLSGFISNTKDYLQLKNKFSFDDADKQAGIAAIADQVNKSSDYKRYMTGVVQTAEGPKSALDVQKATLGIAQSDYVNQYQQQYGKDIYEDLIAPMLQASGAPVSEYDPSVHGDMVRQYIAANVVSKVQQVGNSVPVEDTAASSSTRGAAQAIKEAEAAQVISEIDRISSNDNFLPLERITETVVTKKGFLGIGKETEEKTRVEPVDVLEGEGFYELSKKLNSVGFDAKQIKGLGVDKEGEDDEVITGLEIRNFKTGKKIKIYDLSKYEEQEFTKILKDLATVGTVTGVMTQDGFNEDDLPPIINNQ